MANECASSKQFMKRLGFLEGGSSYAVYKRAISDTAVDISHFTGRRKNSGRKPPVKHDLVMRTFLSFGGNYRDTAEKLGINIRSLYEIVRRHRLGSAINNETT